MSDVLDKNLLQTYIERLRDQARVEKNDVRHRHYVGYINVFLGYFGKEKVYLVGSTGEGFKLRWSKDGGDSDFLLCSGLFEIPVENLVFREDTPCFVWIKADGLRPKIKFDLIQDEYLPTAMLREVNPELFTILRGLYLIITSTRDTVPGRNSRVTTTALSSRVGLARTEYRNLQIPDERIPHPRDRPTGIKRQRTNRKPRTPRYGDDVVIHQKDKEMMDLIINIFTLARTRGSTGSNEGQFANFAHVMNTVKLRRQLGSENTTVVYNEDPEEGFSYVNDLTEDTDTESANKGSSDTTQKRRRGSVDHGQVLSQTSGTYEEKTSKDFVPAFMVSGVLQCILDWQGRKGFWPSVKDKERIAKCEVFVVSRYAPVSPDTEKDFCLSFNQLEIELARCMSDVQRDVFLILKSYLKGGFQSKFNAANLHGEMKLKTFHLKTALYWVLEKEDPALWRPEKIETAVCTVLKFIRKALENISLEHYFIPQNNLFAGFDPTHRDVIIQCVDEALSGPVSYIENFFKLDDGKPIPITLTEDELEALLDMREDGGLENETRDIEEAIIDFHKGFNAGPRDRDGNAPIVKAIEKTWERFLNDVERGELADLQNRHDREKAKDHMTKLIGGLQLTQATGSTGLVSNLVGLSTEPQARDQPTPVSPSVQQSREDASRAEQEQGRQLLGGVLGLLANGSNMDRESRRSREDALKQQAMSFFFGKHF